MTPTQQTRDRLVAHSDAPETYDPPAMADVMLLVRALEAENTRLRNLLSDAPKMVNAAVEAGIRERGFGSASRQGRLIDQYSDWLKNIRTALQEDEG